MRVARDLTLQNRIQATEQPPLSESSAWGPTLEQPRSCVSGVDPSKHHVGSKSFGWKAGPGSLEPLGGFWSPAGTWPMVTASISSFENAKESHGFFSHILL